MTYFVDLIDYFRVPAGSRQERNYRGRELNRFIAAVYHNLYRTVKLKLDRSVFLYRY